MLNIDPNDLQSQLWRGKVTLNHLSLNPKLFEDGLGVLMPMKFHHVHFEKLEIEIFWLSRKIKIRGYGMTGLLENRRQHEWTERMPEL